VANSLKVLLGQAHTEVFHSFFTFFFAARQISEYFQRSSNNRGLGIWGIDLKNWVSCLTGGIGIYACIYRAIQER
jgi:hypothetical protein